MRTSEVLNRAADLIEERGWTTGSEGWGAGSELCLEGGIIAALGMEGESRHGSGFYRCPAYRAVVKYLDLGRHGYDPLWRWNDGVPSSAAEVVEVLRAAALIEAAKENQSVEVSA